MLQREYVAPAYLFVSGNAGPGIRGNMLRHLLNQDEFIAEVKKLGGLSEEFLMNEDLLDFYLPILRADFSIAEQNNLTNEPPVYCPLYALMGSLEEKVDEITNWGRFTRSRFEYKILEGDHFFIHQHPREIAGIIKEKYDFITFLQHQQME
jgi:surfactin synthase thioesterase subunit